MMAANNIGEDGAKALGPHLAKLHNMKALHLSCAWWRWCLDVHMWLFVGSVACVMRRGFVCACMVSVNNIGVEGAKALGPHLAKLNNITALELNCACWR